MANVSRPRPSSRSYASITMSTTSTGESEIIDLTGLTLCNIQMSTVGWTDARIGFTGTVNNSSNFLPLYNTAGDPLTYSTSANRLVVLNPAEFAGIQRLKLVSETSAGVATAQAAARTLVLGLNEV